MPPETPSGARCYWLTGLPAAGKSTIANHLHVLFQQRGIASCVLDGDALRQGLNSDLGFSAADRAESVRRASEVAALMVSAGMVVIVSLVSPYAADRQAARSRFQAGCFVEVHVKTDLQTCIARDPKGLYRRAMAGELAHLTGWADPYEAPQAAEIVIETLRMPADAAAQQLAEWAPVVQPACMVSLR